MEILVSDGLRIFSMIAAFTVLLLVLEVCLMLVGFSSLDGTQGDGHDVDGDNSGEFSHSGAISATSFAHLGIMDPDTLALLDLSRDERAEFLKARPHPLKRTFKNLGLGNGPLMIALACMSACVSSLGFMLQAASENLSGQMLPGWLALCIVILPGLRLAGGMTKWISRMLPSIETQSISARSYNGRRGVVVIGTAKAGSPAHVRWSDQYGGLHNMMVEPLRAEDVIHEGTEVLILRSRDLQPRIVAVS